MFSKLVIAWSLMGLCVAIHASGVASAMRWLQQQPDSAARFWPWTWLFVRLAAWIVLFHLIEIAVWALFFFWKKAMVDLPSALYFSAVTYTTTGYGDLLLPKEWWMMGGVEALTGILMCGWSTGFFFAVVNRVMDRSLKTTEPR
jgi:hypothetical protein